MSKTTIEALVEGGKASGGPPLGPALGPTGINVSEVVAAINEKTKDFEGMKVPVKVIVDTESKTFDIQIGTPPTSALIKKELGLEKGSGDGKPVGDLTFQQLLKITRMKEDALLGSDLKARVKEVLGTCISMGITVEGKSPKDVITEIENGVYDAQLSTDLSSKENTENK